MSEQDEPVAPEEAERICFAGRDPECEKCLIGEQCDCTAQSHPCAYRIEVL